MFYVYLKFVIYLLVAVTSAKFAFSYCAELGSSQNKHKIIPLIILLGSLSVACFYLAINNAAGFMFPHLRM